MQRISRTSDNSQTHGIDATPTVRPRQRGFKYMRMAIVHDGWITDQDGYHTRDISGYVYSIPPTIFVVSDAAWFLGTLIDRYDTHPDFTYHLTQPEQDKDTAKISRTVIGGFGFYRPISPTDQNGKARKALRGRLHQCWDVTAMTQGVFYRVTGERVTPESMFKFAYDVRAWAMEQNLELRNSLSGYASQLLRDPRFYPEARRRVPRATNEKARSALPGNHVELFVNPDASHAYDVTTIDQRSAHHRIVQTLALPNANTLFARGYYCDPPNAPEYFAGRSDTNYDRTIGMPGLLYVGIHSRPTTPGEHRLKKQDFDGYRKMYVWTNEIEFLESTGCRIDGIYAAWTANTDDTGLARYGAFAQLEIESASSDRRRWLKPLLHSTYGLLAAKPRSLHFGHKQARGGIPDSFLLGNREIPVLSFTLKDWAPPIANVIQRGLIEAETQIRSMRMARNLTEHGCTVLHIQADGMHILGKSKLPALSDDWKIGELTHVQYIDNVSWVAFEDSCLPGRDTYHRMRVFERIMAARNHNRAIHTSGGTTRSQVQAQRRTHLQNGDPYNGSR